MTADYILVVALDVRCIWLSSVKFETVVSCDHHTQYVKNRHRTKQIGDNIWASYLCTWISSFICSLNIYLSAKRQAAKHHDSIKHNFRAALQIMLKRKSTQMQTKFLFSSFWIRTTKYPEKSGFESQLIEVSISVANRTTVIFNRQESRHSTRTNMNWYYGSNFLPALNLITDHCVCKCEYCVASPFHSVCCIHCNLSWIFYNRIQKLCESTCLGICRKPPKQPIHDHPRIIIQGWNSIWLLSISTGW